MTSGDALSKNGKATAAREASHYQPIRTRRIFEEICERVRSQMISGELKPGDRLPPERELAEMFAVSRTAVREALRSLEMFGLIDLRKGSHGGAFIVDGTIGVVGQSFRDMVDFGRVSLETFFDARRMIGEMVIRAAAERAEPADFDHLSSIVEDIEALTRTGDAPKRGKRILEFMDVLARQTRNEMVAAVQEATSQVMLNYNKATEPLPYLPIVAGYRLIVAALRERRTDDAVKAYRELIDGASAHMLSLRDQFVSAPGGNYMTRSG